MQKPDLLQGTLDMLILKVLRRESPHGFGICQRFQQLSKDVLSTTSRKFGCGFLPHCLAVSSGKESALVTCPTRLKTSASLSASR